MLCVFSLCSLLSSSQRNFTGPGVFGREDSSCKYTFAYELELFGMAPWSWRYGAQRHGQRAKALRCHGHRTMTVSAVAMFVYIFLVYIYVYVYI